MYCIVHGVTKSQTQLSDFHIHRMCVNATSLSVDGHLSCFYVLTVVNSAVMNTGVHVCFQISVFIFFSRDIPRSGLTGSFGSPLFLVF